AVDGVPGRGGRQRRRAEQQEGGRPERREQRRRVGRHGQRGEQPDAHQPVHEGERAHHGGPRVAVEQRREPQARRQPGDEVRLADRARPVGTPGGVPPGPPPPAGPGVAAHRPRPYRRSSRSTTATLAARSTDTPAAAHASPGSYPWKPSRATVSRKICSTTRTSTDRKSVV